MLEKCTAIGLPPGHPRGASVQRLDERALVTLRLEQLHKVRDGRAADALQRGGARHRVLARRARRPQQADLGWIRLQLSLSD